MKELAILRRALADARQWGNLEAYTLILRGIARLQAMEFVAECDTVELAAVA